MRHLITAVALIATPLTTFADPITKVDAKTDASSDAASTDQASGPDMLRFSNNANNDTLHGSFLSFGKDSTLLWKNPEAAEAITFSTKKIHRIILNNGQGHQAIGQSSTVTLVNGDVIPGRITAANEKTVTLDTDHMGKVTLPSDTVSRISPNPFGGKLLYYGPLSTDGWKLVSPPKPKEDDKAEDKKEEEKAKIEPTKTTNWKHIASAWYAGTNKNSYLTRENALPDRCRLAFKLGWRGSLYCNVALHADFAPPEYDGKENLANNMAATVGHAYVVSISTHSATLYSCSFDEKGKPLSTRIDDTHVSLNLSGKEEGNFEFRIDRNEKQLLLYLNGSFKAKWSLGEKYEGTGNTLAFRNLRYSNAELRVNDIVISQWNGLRDSAESMQTPDRDVILLANGVDRFSGKFSHIRDGKVSFHGTFNNELTIPVEEVQEIRIAVKKLRKMPEEDNDKSVSFYIHPYGKVSGTPSPGANGNTKLISDLLGELNLNTRYVNIIDFSHQNSLLDLWDDNF